MMFSESLLGVKVSSQKAPLPYLSGERVDNLTFFSLSLLALSIFSAMHLLLKLIVKFINRLIRGIDIRLFNVLMDCSGI